MKRIKLVVFTTTILCLAVLMLGRQNKVLAEENATELIILLDASGSMTVNDLHEKAKEWATDLCMLCSELNVPLSCISFQSEGMAKNDSIDILFEAEVIDDNSAKTIAQIINSIDFNGCMTDHLAALDKAVGINRQDAKRVIVMLTDGDLDYIGRLIGEKTEKTQEEKDAIIEFQNKCKEIAKNDILFLVYFSENRELVPDIFQNLEGKNIKLLNAYQDDLSKIAEELLAEIGFCVFENETSKEENGIIHFTLDQPCYRTIVSIKKEPAKIEEDKVHIYRYSEVINENSRKIIDIGSALYIYLNYTEEGDYRIEIEDSKIEAYSVRRQMDYSQLQMDITLMQENNILSVPEKQCEKVYQVNDIKNIKVKVQIRDGSGQSPAWNDMSNSYYKLMLDEEESNAKGEQSLSANNVSEDGALYFDITDKVSEFEKGKTYYCQVHIELSGKTVEGSIGIKVGRSEPTPTVEPVEYGCVKIGEEVDLTPSIKSLMDNYTESDVSFEINGEKVKLGEGKEGIYYLNKKGIIRFETSGKYIVRIECSNGLYSEITICVEVCSMYCIVILVISVLVILIIIWLFARRFRKKS